MGYKTSGDGMSQRGGVRTTMNQPAATDVGKGTDNSCKAPFNAPHDVGNGGIPVHSYVDMGGQPAGTVSPALASNDANTPNDPAPQANRRYGAKL